MTEALDRTRQFKVPDEEIRDVGQILRIVHQALTEKGYNPVSQIVGYLLSGDPTYITSHLNARTLIRNVERDELLEELVRGYLAHARIS
ncbi:MAG: IreB family regulatory phosphoprotein [Syntrophothermus sp.]